MENCGGRIEEYMRIAGESEGFEVIPLRTRHLCGGIGPLNREHNLKKAAEVAKIAVDQHNETNNDNLVFDSLVKANGQLVAGYVWYLTFRVRCPPDDKLMVYQAKVYYNTKAEYLNIIFRPHPTLSMGYPGESSNKQEEMEVKAGESSGKQEMEVKADARSKSHRWIRKKGAKPFSLPRGAFFSFVSNLRKVPEIANMDNDNAIKLASIKWKSMSAPEKKKHCRRSLKPEDIAGLLSESLPNGESRLRKFRSTPFEHSRLYHENDHSNLCLEALCWQLESKLGIWGKSYEDVIRSLRLPPQLRIMKESSKKAATLLYSVVS